MTRRIQILLTVLLLAAAAFTGWQRLSTAAAPDPACDIDCRLQAELALSQDQVGEIGKLIAARQPEMERMFAAYEPRLQAARDEARQKLAQVLTGEQLARFEAFLDEMRQKRLSERSLKSVLLPYCKRHPHAVPAREAAGKGKSHIEQLMLQLELTPEQEQPVRAILTALRNEVIPVKRELKLKIEPLQQEATRAVEALLTPEQQARLAKIARAPASLCGGATP